MPLPTAVRPSGSAGFAEELESGDLGQCNTFKEKSNRVHSSIRFDFYQNIFETLNRRSQGKMDLFEVLMGSGKNREDHQEYVNRYEQGPAWEGYSDQEVLDRYGSVAHKVSPVEYEQAAREAFDRLSPEQQAEFARYLEERARKRNITIPRRETGAGGGLGIWTGFQRSPGKSTSNRGPSGTCWARTRTPPPGWGGFYPVRWPKRRWPASVPCSSSVS